MTASETSKICPATIEPFNAQPQDVTVSVAQIIVDLRQIPNMQWAVAAQAVKALPWVLSTMLEMNGILKLKRNPDYSPGWLNQYNQIRQALLKFGILVPEFDYQ